MKRTTSKKRVTRSTHKNKSRLSKASRPDQELLRNPAIATRSLDQEVPEEFREPVPNEIPDEPYKPTNWSEAQDRSEDLATMKDPFTQGPERDTQVPPELTQEKIGRTLDPNENLADRFDAERRSPAL